MEHLRATVATLVGLMVTVGLMVILAIGSNIKNPSYPAEMCEDSVQCDIPPQPSPGPDEGQNPHTCPASADHTKNGGQLFAFSSLGSIGLCAG